MTDETHDLFERHHDRINEILRAQVRGENGPQVNPQLLKRYFAEELTDDQAAEVDHLATKYEPWAQAFFAEGKKAGWFPEDLAYPGVGENDPGL